MLNSGKQFVSSPTGGLQQGVALAAAVALPLLIGAAGAVVTNRSRSTWYATLRKPSFNPPSWVFAPVWTTLYGLMGLASWLVWQQGRTKGWLGNWWPRHAAPPVRSALVLYAIQLAANLVWSWLFFGWRRVDLALAEIVVLWGLILATLVRFSQVRPLSGWLLLPYQLWVSFATVLNLSIWWLNRHHDPDPNSLD